MVGRNCVRGFKGPVPRSTIFQLSSVSSVQRETIDWLKSLRSRPHEVSMAPKLIWIRTTLKYTIRKSVLKRRTLGLTGLYDLQLPPTRGMHGPKCLLCV